jgi:hypothetical protein
VRLHRARGQYIERDPAGRTADASDIASGSKWNGRVRFGEFCRQSAVFDEARRIGARIVNDDPSGRGAVALLTRINAEDTDCDTAWSVQRRPDAERQMLEARAADNPYVGTLRTRDQRGDDSEGAQGAQTLS